MIEAVGICVNHCKSRNFMISRERWLNLGSWRRIISNPTAAAKKEENGGGAEEKVNCTTVRWGSSWKWGGRSEKAWTVIEGGKQLGEVTSPPAIKAKIQLLWGSWAKTVKDSNRKPLSELTEVSGMTKCNLLGSQFLWGYDQCACSAGWILIATSYFRECGGRGGACAASETYNKRGGRKATRWGRTFIRWTLIKTCKDEKCLMCDL